MIPTSFQLVNRKWRVKLVSKAAMKKAHDAHPIAGGKFGKMMGWCDSMHNIIYLNRDLHTNDAELEATFWHEFLHALLYANGELSHNEDYVERFGGFLHQFEQTKKGQLES